MKPCGTPFMNFFLFWVRMSFFFLFKQVLRLLRNRNKALWLIGLHALLCQSLPAHMRKQHLCRLSARRNKKIKTNNDKHEYFYSLASRIYQGENL